MDDRWKMLWALSNPVITVAIAGAAEAVADRIRNPAPFGWGHVLRVAGLGALIGIVNLYRNRPGTKT